MRAVFNSLGSNYQTSFVFLALKQLIGTDPTAPKQLAASLESRFGGTPHLFYKGRDAIEFALRAIGIKKGELVLSQALSCYAVEEAIVRAGGAPLYVDIAQGELNMSLETVEAAYEGARKQGVVRALIVQHLLGSSADIITLAKWCKKNSVILIEDLAQSFGGYAAQADGSVGQELGTYGDMTICSFGRDKVIDAVSGGACIVRNPSYKARARSVYANQVAERPSAILTSRDLLYPLVSWLIRMCHGFGLDVFFYALGQLTGILNSPTSSPTSRMTQLPPSHAVLALAMLSELEKQLYHRRKIARLYLEHFQTIKNIKLITTESQIALGVPLRIALVVEKPDLLSETLKKSHIYLTDRWYRSAADSGRLKKQSQYLPGNCPNTEEIVVGLYNLPTHRNCTPEQAVHIVAAIAAYSAKE